MIKQESKNWLVACIIISSLIVNGCDKEEKKKDGNLKKNSSPDTVVPFDSTLDYNTITVIGWNVESGGAHVDTLAQQMKELGIFDLWGLAEVESASWAQKFETAVELKSGYSYSGILGESGNEDRLLLLVNTNKFDILDNFEIDDINVSGTVRAPLVTRLKNRKTSKELYFMVNHLYRSKADRRQEQARMLNDWINEQSIPVIAVGDYNFDYDVDSHAGNSSFDLFVETNKILWVEPNEKTATQCNPGYNSILDFIFINDDAMGWEASSTIIVRDKDCEQAQYYSDHRPVSGIFNVINE